MSLASCNTDVKRTGSLSLHKGGLCSVGTQSAVPASLFQPRPARCASCLVRSSAIMAAGGRRRIDMLRIGSAYHGFVYQMSDEPGKYKCRRGPGTPGDDGDDVLWLFKVDQGWVAVSAPQTLATGPPSKDWIWDHGRKVYWCKHTGIRDGWHRWTPWGEDHWEEDGSFWCKTEVALTSDCGPTENHDGIVDLTTDFSDSDNDIPPNDAPPNWQLLPP